MVSNWRMGISDLGLWGAGLRMIASIPPLIPFNDWFVAGFSNDVHQGCFLLRPTGSPDPPVIWGTFFSPLHFPFGWPVPPD